MKDNVYSSAMDYDEGDDLLLIPPTTTRREESLYSKIVYGFSCESDLVFVGEENNQRLAYEYRTHVKAKSLFDDRLRELEELGRTLNGSEGHVGVKVYDSSLEGYVVELYIGKVYDNAKQIQIVRKFWECIVNNGLWSKQQIG